MTPILFFCWDAESLLESTSIGLGVAVLLILSFVPLLTLFSQSASWVVLLPFYFSPSSDSPPLMQYLD